MLSICADITVSFTQLFQGFTKLMMAEVHEGEKGMKKHKHRKLSNDFNAITVTSIPNFTAYYYKTIHISLTLQAWIHLDQPNVCEK